MKEILIMQNMFEGKKEKRQKGYRVVGLFCCTGGCLSCAIFFSKERKVELF